MIKVQQALAILLLLATGCEDEVVVGAPSTPAAPAAPAAPVSPAPVAPGTPSAPPGAESAAEEEAPSAAELSYSDDEFVELDVRNRDPFRRFVSVVRPTGDRRPARRVVVPQTAIDEMRLIAIVGGIARPRAMLQDSTGVGFVVTQGEYIGREEVLQAGSSDSMPVTLNWQVARIRSSTREVVLTRTDPTAPDRPPLTRVIPLYDEEDPSQRNLMIQ